MKELTKENVRFIEDSCQYLEFPSLLIKLTNLVGKPIEIGMAAVPPKMALIITQGTNKALSSALNVAVNTLKTSVRSDSFETAMDNSFWSRIGHDITAIATGAAGGFLGLLTLPVELPVTTGIMLRSIASIANNFGEGLNDPTVRLECLNVFALGSPQTTGDDAVTPAYFGVRHAMAEVVREATHFLSRVGAEELTDALARGTAPALVRYIMTIAARFEVVVTEKALAQAIPITGAVAGGLINLAFTEHFNAVAKYHFGIRRLERDFGKDAIVKIYNAHFQALKTLRS